MRRTLKALVTVAVAAVVTLPIPVGVAHADPAAPQRCKDAPIQTGPFTTNSRICDNGNGTVTSCYSGPLPMFGPPCRDWPASTLPPGFWDQP
ncbi:hypothetical protein [Candidatus Mycobacterium methanotrophicum]|uniref:Secreted protein n=1 Tax=Candidatus Mycobacterium methanotrophicum TaxID=2943498 RepID=A0ABY4QHG4_9MYCO|nr:hypothetical protein [Candidatus Mycobacterium methanotrophicum]UQX09652.1 hypothetical protein M5I08_15045 [Candidatus Mycobacterium methanotrophicum]